MTPEEIDMLAKAIGREIALSQKAVFTVSEAAAYLGISESTLYKHTSAQEIPYYKPNGKICYFKRTELDAWMAQNPVATNKELERRAMAYCAKNRRL